MRQLINYFITRVRGEKFELDNNIPTSYLISFLIQKLIHLIWGFFIFRRFVYIAPSASIKCKCKFLFGKNLSIAERCVIDALSVDGVVLGDNVSIGFNTYIRVTGSFKHIGNTVKIGNNVGLGTHGYYGCGVGKLIIGNDCIFGNFVSIHPENHNFSDKSIPIRLQGVNSLSGVVIGNNCWIGSKVTILEGTNLGDGCIVAAGAVVKGVFPPDSIIGGVPAKILKTR